MKVFIEATNRSVCFKSSEMVVFTPHENFPERNTLVPRAGYLQRKVRQCHLSHIRNLSLWMHATEQPTFLTTLETGPLISPSLKMRNVCPIKHYSGVLGKFVIFWVGQLIVNTSDKPKTFPNSLKVNSAGCHYTLRRGMENCICKASGHQHS